MTTHVDQWMTITGPMAWCATCTTDAGYHGDGDRDARKAIMWARKHAERTGHRVIVERGQTLRVDRI